MSQYSFVNKTENDNSIKVLGEDEPDIITYSVALAVCLTRLCRNNCPYCGFSKKDQLVVPYSTIKNCKIAKQKNAAEVVYTAGERPDKFAQIRANLDLWGFGSYLDYIYTICELGFLEGLIPVLDLGFMNPFELKKLSEISAIVKIMLDSVDTKTQQEFYNLSPGKRLEIRLKSISWAAKLQIPVATGFIIGGGETQTHRKEMLQEIVKTHTEYNNIHEVLLQNFVPMPNTPLANIAPPTKKVMLKAVEQALEILPSDIKVIVPIEQNPDFADFIRAGIRDLGRIYVSNNEIFSNHQSPTMSDVEATIQSLGFRPQQRFPLRLNYIKNGRFSKKLGQVFDVYRYKIKKEEQEKLKDAKLNAK